jgi:hypothetical protein
MAIVRAKFEPVREMAYSSITTSFQQIGTPFAATFSVIYVQNLTDQIIDFSVSYNGTDIAFSLAPMGTLSTDMVTNSVQVSAGESAWAKYRSGSAPSKGFVQVSAITPA